MPLPTTHCAPLSPDPSPLPSLLLPRRPLVPCAGSEPAPRYIKDSPQKRTRMTRIGRIFTDFPIRVNPCHPRNPCSTSASLFVDAPEIRNVIYIRFAQTTNLRSSAFICGSFFAEAPDSKGSDGINRMDNIKSSANPVNLVHPVQSGSSFSTAPDINCYEFIKTVPSQNSSPQSHHIPPTSLSKHGTLLSERRLNAARKTKYAFLQLFNSRIDKTGDNENI